MTNEMPRSVLRLLKMLSGRARPLDKTTTILNSCLRRSIAWATTSFLTSLTRLEARPKRRNQVVHYHSLLGLDAYHPTRIR